MAAQSKKEEVAKLVEKFKEAKSIIFVSYTGITVNEDTELRKKARDKDINYFVAKNRLVKLALKEAGIEDNFDEILEGTTSFAVGYEDEISSSKLIYDASSDLKEKISIKAGYMNGQRVDVSVVESYAKLPSRDELLSQIAYGLLSPVRMLAIGLTNVAEQQQ